MTTRRVQIMDEWVAAGLLAGDGFAFRVDADVEEAHHVWLARGRPAGSIWIENGPNDTKRVVLTVSDGSPPVLRW